MPEASRSALLQRKLELLAGFLAELEPLVRPGRQPGGNLERRAMERLVQVVVEAAIDVNGLLLAARSLPPPGSARESFVSVRDAGLLPKNVAERFILSYVGLRNRIVHDYDTLDPSLVARAASRLLSDARAYARAVASHLDDDHGPSRAREPRVPYRRTPSPRLRSPVRTKNQ
ncbi:MAG: DUF86 domain-containing protein [Deltaproteobacteria bacterium]|nr:DUF86 domain-containing protein [Deltaproteobacteria bacterium]